MHNFSSIDSGVRELR